MSKKICFVLPHMLMAGVEKSLLDLLKKLDDYFQIDVYLIKEIGDLCEQIPRKNYHGTLPLSEWQRKEAYRSCGKKKALIYHLKKMNLIRAWKLMFEPSVYDYLTEGWDNMEVLPERYDVAVCYHMHHNFIIGYVAKKIVAEKHVMWIHNDINHSGFPIEQYKEYLDVYDLFVCVSEQIKKELIEHMPHYAYRAVVFHNIINSSEIRRRAQEFVPEVFGDEEKLKIVTVARLEYEKGIDLAIKAAKKLNHCDVKFIWIVLGDGRLKDGLLRQIRRENLEKNFLLLGNKENPYPYLKSCDVFVQASRHEGYGIALAEAIMFGKIVISTDVAGAKEQIINGENGYIVDINADSISKKIIYIYRNRNSIVMHKIVTSINRDNELNQLKAYFEQ